MEATNQLSETKLITLVSYYGSKKRADVAIVCHALSALI